jgi:hypothetical protein
MKKTAVDWLSDEINKMNVSREATLFINKLKKQAKQMEKEQIMDAVESGENNIDSDGCCIDKEFGEQYYKETYETNTESN